MKKFDLNDEIIGTYTNKGWATENCILLVLEQIVLVTSDEESVLLMDQYSSHITDKIDEDLQKNSSCVRKKTKKAHSFKRAWIA